MASSESGGSGSSGGCRVRSVKLVRRAPPAKLGFSVRGGREHGTGFFVTSVEPQSEAHCAGLRAGDQIVRVNGYPVDDATHGELLQLIQSHTSIVLRVRTVGMIPEKEDGSGELSWRIVEPDSLTWSPELSEPLNRQTEVPLSIKVPPKAKLGCGICKGPDWKPGIFVQFTKENSIARSGGLRPGDQILQCNNVQFTPEMPFNEAVSIMRGCGVLDLVLKKGAGLDLFPGESSGYNSSASSIAGDHPASSWEHASTVTNGDNSTQWNNSNNISADHSPNSWNNHSSQSSKVNLQENGTNLPEKRLVNGSSTTDKRLVNGSSVSDKRHLNGTSVPEKRHVNGITAGEKRLVNGVAAGDKRLVNGITVGEKRLVNGGTIPDKRVANGVIITDKRHISGGTVPDKRHANGTLSDKRNGNVSSAQEKRQGSRTESNSTIIQVPPPLLNNSDAKVAEICMVSQQTETKTTTVLVEVHHSEEDNASNSQSDTSTDRQTSSSVSSFTSSAGSLRCAISQELQRRSKRAPTTPRQPTEKLVKSGLTKEELHKHEQLMNEFKKAHHKMFPQQVGSASEREEEKESEAVKEPRRSECSSKSKNRIDESGRSRNRKPPPPPPPMPNGVDSRQKKGPAPAPPVSTADIPPAPTSDPPSCPTPDYDSLSLASEYQQSNDRVDMQSLESFRLTNPHPGKPKPPDTYFPKQPVECRSTVLVRPLVTVGQYGGDSGKPRVAKLDFLAQPAPPPPSDQPIQIRLASELSHTLARSSLKDNQGVNGTSAKNGGHPNGCKGSIIKISVENTKDNNTVMDGRKQAPFYLFPEGGRRNNSVSFDLSGSESTRTHTHQHGILKNSNVSHVQIHPQVEKTIPHKSIKFGPMSVLNFSS